MLMRVKTMGWVILAVLALGTMGTGSAAMAQEATTTEQPAMGAGDTPAADPAAPAGDTAADTADVFNQAALPTVSEEELEAEVKLPPLRFLIEWFNKGGVFMWPLLLSSVVGVGVVLERFYTLNRIRVNTRNLMSRIVGALREQGPQGAIEICQRTRGPIAAILHAGLMRAPKGPDAVKEAIESAGTIEMSFLQRGLVILASVTNVAPLLGFLGTVSGMINAFEAIAAADTVSAKLVGAGISEALITTEAGLMIAIPIQLCTNYFISRIDRFIIEMEEASVELMDTMVDMEARRG